ncbi:MAG: hypothetical protein RLY86_1079 [Pseudomonadota bacterium]|jgi:hypothetical protein
MTVQEDLSPLAIPPVSEEGLSAAMKFALGVVENLGSHGLTSVPVKPSRDMLLAGANAGGISVQTAWQVYTAMLRAAE